MNETLKKIIFATIGVLGMIALVAIGLTAAFVIIGLLVVLWIYGLLVRKGIINGPKMGQHFSAHNHPSNPSVVDAEYEVVEDKEKLPRD